MASKLEVLKELGFTDDEILARVLVGGISASSRPMAAPGEAVFVRTCTDYFTGRVVSCDDKAIVLSDASWIADTGRLSAFVEKGVPNEAEFLGDVRVAVGSVVSVLPWNHALPVVTK